MFVPDDNMLFFSVCSTFYIKYLSVLCVHEEPSLILEDLPPVGIGRMTHHILAGSRALDIP